MRSMIRSDNHHVQTHAGREFLLPSICADEFVRCEHFRRCAVQHIQRTASDRCSMVFGKLHCLLKNVFPFAASRHQHTCLQICLDSRASRRHLRVIRALKKYLQLKRIHELQFVKRRITNRLALDLRNHFGAVRLRIVKFDETAGVQIGYDSPPRASETTALSGLPEGCSPQIDLARAKKSGCVTDSELAGTTLATTLSCCITCTSSPSATHRKICGHSSGNCWTLAVFTRKQSALKRHLPQDAS